MAKKKVTKKTTKKATKKPAVKRAASSEPKSLKVVERTAGPMENWQEVERLDTQQQFATASLQYRELKVKLDAAEKERKVLVKPFNDGVKQINQKFKQTVAPAKELLGHIQDLMEEWGERDRRKQQKAIEAKAKRAEKRGDTELAGDIREDKALVRAEGNEAVKTKIVWEVEVTDPIAVLGAVAKGQLPMDVVEIKTYPLKRLAVEAKREGEIFPGVRAYTKTQYVRN